MRERGQEMERGGDREKMREGERTEKKTEDERVGEDKREGRERWRGKNIFHLNYVFGKETPISLHFFTHPNAPQLQMPFMCEFSRQISR